MTGGCATHTEADRASSPCCWPQSGTLPRHSNGRRHSGASRNRRQGCRLETLDNLKWTDECRDNPPSQCQCRR
jgi:hypothetical protein